MSLFLLFAVALGVAAFLIVILAVTAPVGYENEDGFHYGVRPSMRSPMSNSGRYEGSVPRPRREAEYAQGLAVSATFRD